jgi:hypothetical protein
MTWYGYREGEQKDRALERTNSHPQPFKGPPFPSFVPPVFPVPLLVDSETMFLPFIFYTVLLVPIGSLRPLSPLPISIQIFPNFAYFSVLKMEANNSSETLIFYQTKLFHIRKDSNRLLHIFCYWLGSVLPNMGRMLLPILTSEHKIPGLDSCSGGDCFESRPGY